MKWNRFIRHSVLPLVFFLFASVGRLVIAGEFPFARIIRVGETFEKIRLFFEHPLTEIKLFGTGFPIGLVLIMIWLSVSIIMLILYLYRLISDAVRIRQIPADRDLKSEAVLHELLRERKQSDCSITVFRTEKTKVPFLNGVVHPSIYLPQIELDPDELKGVLIHEWSHAFHHDILVRILISVICIIFWWNPLVYLLRRNMYHSMELRCDQEAQRILTENECDTYVSALLRIAENSCEDPGTAVGAVGLVSAVDKCLVQRFELLTLTKCNIVKARIATAIFCIVMVLLLILSYMFVIQPYVGYATPGEDYLINEETQDTPPLSDFQVWSGTYIVDNGDGTYSIFCDGELLITTDDITSFENTDIEIIQGE